ncbi:class I SAM-dependent methyltransferase [Fodinibius salsisoli]|uniref:Class I SAM-dependent methyltransferase n=1 Tax=Fodinibius salsisoli TaxID=2820877 RepID=A0ABT3PT98_9BACT|nr:class I SAM-dependent methyltransferase [Fodinibius salsisoli]MCW9709080.1 class I SAM-dependent methyltransferase [Fodinibius salsisoli]
MTKSSSSHTTSTSSQQSQKVEAYYQLHAQIYDATRWSFLFGRENLLDKIPDLPSQPHILEIGCGTGKNMERLSYHFPDASIVGIDLSPDMLQKAKKRLGSTKDIELKLGQYGKQSFNYDSFDLILVSYSLTMFDDNIEDVFEQICKDLKPQGYIAAVDFHTSPFNWFCKWMEMNHVDFSEQLFSLFKKYFSPSDIELKKAYGGLWTYFQFVGRQS